MLDLTVDLNLNTSISALLGACAAHLDATRGGPAAQPPVTGQSVAIANTSGTGILKLEDLCCSALHPGTLPSWCFLVCKTIHPSLLALAQPQSVRTQRLLEVTS